MKRLVLLILLVASPTWAASQSTVNLSPPATPVQQLATEAVTQGGATVQQERQVGYPSSVTSLQTGQVAVATPQTPQPLRSGTPTPCRYVEVHADQTNAGVIVVGGCTVTTSTGRKLWPGEVWSMEAPDGSNCTNNICINGATNGDGASWSSK